VDSNVITEPMNQRYWQKVNLKLKHFIRKNIHQLVHATYNYLQHCHISRQHVQEQ